MSLNNDDLSVLCRCGYARREHAGANYTGMCLVAGSRCTSFTPVAAEPTTTEATAYQSGMIQRASNLGMPAEVIGPFRAWVESLTGRSRPTSDR
jgi:hypothetical protein